MNDPIYAEIISLIDSVCMRDHLLADPLQIRTNDYLDIIAGAPVSLERKRELLAALQKAARSGRERAEIGEYLGLLEEGLNKLHSFSPDKSVLIIVNIHYDSEDGRPVYRHDEFFPAASYSGARLAIRRYNDECELAPGELPPWYWKMELYEMQEDGTSEPDYTYICSSDGEAQYFYPYTVNRQAWRTRGIGGFDPFAFGHSSPNLNLPVPFQPGDILSIDCRPYTQPAHCLITEVSNDCCGVRCVYRQGGRISAGALKHGHYSEDADGEKHYLSPLYRAEIYEGELPPEDAFLAELSKRLKRDPACGGVIEDIICALP